MSVLSAQHPKASIFSAHRFKLQDKGVSLQISVNVTEKELQRGLIEDIPLTRLAIDLAEHIKKNPWGTCMCMHHLMFLKGKGSQDIVPRRFCVLYNKKRGESEVMVNPVAVGRSRASGLFLQKSRGCRETDLPVKVQRPQKLWVEWEDMILDYKKPAGTRARRNYARFTGQEAACLALILEELAGTIRCGKGAKVTSPIKTPPSRASTKFIPKAPAPIRISGSHTHLLHAHAPVYSYEATPMHTKTTVNVRTTHEDEIDQARVEQRRKINQNKQ